MTSTLDPQTAPDVTPAQRVDAWLTDFEAALAAFKDRQPMGRLGQPEEIAALVCYLASDAAGFTTGQALAR